MTVTKLLENVPGISYVRSYAQLCRLYSSWQRPKPLTGTMLGIK